MSVEFPRGSLIDQLTTNIDGKKKQMMIKQISHSDDIPMDRSYNMKLRIYVRHEIESLLDQ